jgi:hypothetical protein
MLTKNRGIVSRIFPKIDFYFSAAGYKLVCCPGGEKKKDNGQESKQVYMD